MNTNVITLAELAALNCSTFTVKDDSPRGCCTKMAREVKTGDRVCLGNHFVEVVENPAPAETETAEAEQEQSGETFAVTFYSAVSHSMCVENFNDYFKAEKFARQMLEAIDYPCVIVSTLCGMKLIEETRFFK